MAVGEALSFLRRFVARALAGVLIGCVVPMAASQAALQAAPEVASAAAGASPFAEGAHAAFADRVRTAEEGEYGRVLAEFDAYFARAPADAVAAVERCRFIEEFAYVEEARPERTKELEACQENLRSGAHAPSPAARVYLWRSKLWDDEAIEKGEALLKEAATWSLEQRATLHEGMSLRYGERDAARSREHAAIALDLNPESASWLKAAEHYAHTGALDVAIAILEAVPKQQWHGHSLQNAVSLLIERRELTAARRLIDAHQDVDLQPEARFDLAGKLIVAGDAQTGRALVAKFAEGAPLPERYGPWLARTVFAFQLEHGTAEEAVAAYRKLRDQGLSADPLGWRRLALSARHWNAPWQWTDLGGIVVLLTVLAFCVLLPSVVLVPLHYRGAVRRANGLPLPPLSADSPWRLRDAWYVLAALLIGDTIAMYLFAYTGLETMVTDLFEVFGGAQPELDDRMLGRAMLFGTVFGVVLLLPVLRKLDWRAIFVGRWPISHSVLTGLALAVLVMAVHGVTRAIAGPPAVPVQQIGVPETTRAILGMHAAYGGLATLLVVALVVPLLEEFAFRGVLLRVAARHVHVWVAIGLQAALFMFAHEEVARFPGFLVFGLSAGWLAWKSGGLLGPITLHVANNTIACLVIFSVGAGAPAS